MQDLVNEMNHKRQELNAAIQILKERGIDKAKAENKYRMELSKEILIQRDNKIPVTIISDICRGKKEIAKLKLDRDIADIMYESVMQRIYATKLELQILDNQIKAEWKGDGS